MKTTVELPDALFVEAKKAAAEQRTTLRTFIERAVRCELSRLPAAKKPGKIHWVTVDGGLPPGIDLTDRAQMHDWFRRQR